MKITGVTLHPVATRRRNGKLSYHVTVVLTTDDGITGLGEFSDLSHTPAVMPDLGDLQEYLNQLLRGIDPLDLTQVEEILDRSYPHQGKFQLIKTGLEIACHDAAAKSLDLPLYRLLGGAKRDRIPICYPIFRTRRVEDVPQQLEYVQTALDHGFNAIRYYFGGNLDADERFLDELRDRFGDRVQVKSLDASGLFTWKEALAAYDRLRRFDFMLLESPVPRDDIDGLARVTAAIDRPVSEHVKSIPYALELIQHKAVDIFNVSLVQIGGIRNAIRLYDLAAAVDIQCLVGTTQEMSIGTAAQAHAAAVARCPILRSDPVGPFLYTTDVVKENVRYEDGYLVVPDGPGLGLELDEEKLAANRRPLSTVDR